jgi:CMP-N-acetylneuraminic acid synthetase
MEGDFVVPFMHDHGFGMRSQDLPSTYVVNGSFYLISPAELRRSRSFLSSKIMPLIMESKKEALDIDTEWDWLLAENFLNLP